MSSLVFILTTPQCKSHHLITTMSTINKAEGSDGNVTNIRLPPGKSPPARWHMHMYEVARKKNSQSTHLVPTNALLCCIDVQGMRPPRRIGLALRLVPPADWPLQHHSSHASVHTPCLILHTASRTRRRAPAGARNLERQADGFLNMACLWMKN